MSERRNALGKGLEQLFSDDSMTFEELETTLQRKNINEIKLDEAAADLDLVSSVHKQVVEGQ